MAPERWFGRALALTLAITALRIVLLAFDRTDLFVDEAQYWLWAQDPALGYYSKPPMIAWVIWLSTLPGDGTFWVRLPAPVFNGAAGLLLGAVAARAGQARAAVWVVAVWLTLPMVALGSLLISTDVILFPFLAAALWAYVACLSGAGWRVAALGGVALGLGFLAKYAAVYPLVCAVLAAGLRPRLSGRQAAVFLGGFVIAASPNVLWNLTNGLTTVQHTLDNAGWLRDPGRRAGLHGAEVGSFLLAQFGVFGPVLFAALLALGATWRRRTPLQRRWLLFSLPIVAAVSVQAALSHAYANWAATAYLAGTLLVVPWLTPRWRIAALAINGALCLALPLATVFADRLTVSGRPLLARYLGRAEMSRGIIAAARTAGVRTVVSGNRDILADLFYTGRDSGLTFRALAPQGRAMNHYALRYPFRGDEAPVLFVARRGEPVCRQATSLGRIDPATGAWQDRPMALWRLPGTCL